MAREESLMKGGYYAFPEEYLEAVVNLFMKRASARVLDPCAGEGFALQAISKGLSLQPFAIELEETRAQSLQAMFGTSYALQSDMFQMSITKESMQMIWCNPPFAVDSAVNERREASMLLKSWEWLQPGGWMIFISYNHHISRQLALDIAQRSESIELFRLPELHFGTYCYTVLVAKSGKCQNAVEIADNLYNLASQAENIPLLTSATTKRIIPAPTFNNIVFTKAYTSTDTLLNAVRNFGAENLTAFKTDLAPVETFSKPVNPVVRPKMGHMLTLIAAGLFNYVKIETSKGVGILRSTIRYVEQEIDKERTPDNKSTKTKVQIKPTTKISVMYANGDIEDISDDDQLMAFIQQNKKALFDYAQQRFTPRYDLLGKSPEKQKWLPHMKRQRVKGVHSLFPAQQHVGAAICTTLEQIHRCYFVGEMSTGKTTVSLSVMDAWHKTGEQKKGQVMFVTCPSHLVKKWKREANQQLPNAHVTTLVLEDENGRHDMLAECARAMRQADAKPNDLHIIIASQDAIKLGEGWQPAYVKIKRRPKATDKFKPKDSTPQRIKEFTVCPVTYEPIDIDHSKQLFSDNRRNAYWQEIRTIGLPKGNNGRVTKTDKGLIPLNRNEPILDNWIASHGIRWDNNPRGPLYRLLENRYKGRIAIFFIDESHQSNNIATDRYRSIAGIARCSDNIVGLTGTIFNGYASSIYGLETIFNPSLFKDYEWGSAGINKFVRDMGVLEKTIEIKDVYTENGYLSGTKRITHGAKEVPGASPLLIQMIIDHAVFLSLSDLGKALPQLTESPQPVTMNAPMASAYENGNRVLKSYLNECRQQKDNSFLAAYYRSLLGYPDSSFLPMVVNHHLVQIKDRKIISEKDYTVHKFPSIEGILNKESWVIDIVKEELQQGRGVGIFVTQTDKRDVQPRLAELLKNHAGAKPVILTSKVKPIQREEWLEKQFANGKANVLICNPMLVETGLDILQCPTLIFMAPEMKFSVLSQASRRHWRIPQTKPCKTYYAYYEETMEEKGMALITKKIKSSAVLTGESAGLSTLTSSSDIMKELLNDDVPVMDLRAEFAVINQRDYDDSEWMIDMESEPNPVPEQTIEELPMVTNTPIPAHNVPDYVPAKVQLSLF